MLINARGLVWIGRRLPKWVGDKSASIWQMPQGGISLGETEQAAHCASSRRKPGVTWVNRGRELPIRASSYGAARASDGRRLFKGRYRGQKQKWFGPCVSRAMIARSTSARTVARGRIRRLALGAHRRAAGPDPAVQTASLRRAGRRVRSSAGLDDGETLDFGTIPDTLRITPAAPSIARRLRPETCGGIVVGVGEICFAIAAPGRGGRIQVSTSRTRSASTVTRSASTSAKPPFTNTRMRASPWHRPRQDAARR